MPNNVELVRLRMLRVREGVVAPSVDGGCSGAWTFDPKLWLSEGGVDGAEDGAEASSKRRPRGRGFITGPSSSSLNATGWDMLGPTTPCWNELVGKREEERIQ